MFEQVWTIARNTFTESLRQPVFVVLLVAVILLLILNPFLSNYTLGDDDKLMIDLGLSMMFIGGIFLASFTAAGVLAREIDNKTVLTVISKPIGRPAFIFGKYLGVVAAVIMAYWAWAVVFLLTVRHEVMSTAADKVDQPVVLFGLLAILGALALSLWGNYFYNWVFSSRFSVLLAIGFTAAYLLVLMIDKKWEFQPITAEFAKDEGHLWQVMIAMLGVLEGLAILCAIAIACSTRLGQVMTLCVCLGFYFVGLISDGVLGQLAQRQPWAWTLYILPPNLGFLWLADALTQKSIVTVEYVAMVSGYVVLYIFAVLCLAVALFQTRETG